MPVKTFQYLVPGLCKVWHTVDEKHFDFIIHDRDYHNLTVEQLDELVKLKKAGKLEEVNPLQDPSIGKSK